jgi:hypothetical protein
VVGSCKHGDEPLGSGATELVMNICVKNTVSVDKDMHKKVDFLAKVFILHQLFLNKLH